MPTSGATTGLDTARDIITDALRELQIVSANRQPTASDLELGRRRLNWMLKEWQQDGANLWREEDVNISWPAATAEGDLSPNINDVIDLRYPTGATTEMQLNRWEWADYQSLPAKSTAGQPTIYTVAPGLTALRMRLWPVPADAVTLTATINRVIEDVDDVADTIDVPQQYTSTVMMNLAARLAPAFGRANDPNAVVTIRQAAQLYRVMRAADRPASYFLQSARAR